MLRSIHKIRGLAALAVVISHLANWGAVPPQSIWSGLLAQLGQEAVAVFFVISGFIIAWSHRKELGKIDRLYGYAVRRALRIYPPYWACSLLLFVIVALGFQPMIDPSFSFHRAPLQLLISIFLIPTKYPAGGFLAVSWSLFYEVFFYLLFSTFFLNRKLGFGVLGLLCLTSAANHPLWIIPSFFFSRINLFFAFGVLLGLRPDLLANLRLPPWVLFLMAAICYLVMAALRMNFHSPIAFACATLLVAAAVHADYSNRDRLIPPPGKFERAALWLGTISYSLYLCHVPVQVVLRGFLGTPSSPLTAMAFILVPIAIASLSYLAIERPTQNLARHLTGKRSIKLPPVVATIAQTP